MSSIVNIPERRTRVDTVFDYLYEEINSLRLLPGTKITESEIADLIGVSRQPVRDAFSRLDNIGLLVIRAQKATEVKKFSYEVIKKSRFLRAAVEAEVLRRAAQLCDHKGASLLEESLVFQQTAVENKDHKLFGRLDYAFHNALCTVAKVDFAFDFIEKEKATVDRLCVLGLEQDERLEHLFLDHQEITRFIKENNKEGAVKVGMAHLSRLDATIETISVNYSQYFED